MSISNIHERINALLRLIEINNNRLFLNEKEIPKIELHQLRNYIVELYTEVDRLELNSDEKSQNNIFQEEPKVEAPKKQIVKKPDPEPEKVVETQPEPIETDIPQKPDVPQVLNEKAIEIEQNKEILKKESTLPPEAQPGKEQKKVSMPSASNTRGDLYEKFKNSKLESIKKGISISKRYEYQNELFKNDPKSYTDAIQMLDSSATLEDAVHFLENTLGAEYNWDLENPLVDELKVLCLRRHM